MTHISERLASAFGVPFTPSGLDGRLFVRYQVLDAVCLERPDRSPIVPAIKQAAEAGYRVLDVISVVSQLEPEDSWIIELEVRKP